MASQPYGGTIPNKAHTVRAFTASIKRISLCSCIEGVTCKPPVTARACAPRSRCVCGTTVRPGSAAPHGFCERGGCLAASHPHTPAFSQRLFSSLAFSLLHQHSPEITIFIRITQIQAINRWQRCLIDGSYSLFLQNSKHIITISIVVAKFFSA